jgi:uncharacterized membrane protein YkvA (DUF1232 family)
MKNSTVQSMYSWYRNTLRNPKYRWLVIGASLLYLLSPLDISPDLFPIVGWLDDGIIVGLLVAELSQIMMESLKGGAGGTGGTSDTVAGGSATPNAASPATGTAAKPDDATATVDVQAVAADD